MSLDRKYEAYLCDLLSLMQEALLRLFQQKAMDRNKFKHYFTHFHQKMTVLEESFQEHRLKATTTLAKLRDYCMADEVQANIQTSRQNNKSGCDKPIQPPLVRAKSNNKVNTHSRELNSIQEEEQEHTNKRRSETAGAFRSRQNPKLNNNRPMTGFVNSRDRYQNQTISYEKPHNINTSSSHSNHKLDAAYFHNTVELHQNPHRRKSFYDDLEKQARQEPPPGKKNRITFRNKLNGSQQKWTQKISRLL